jgi:hypothetical protein
LSAYVIAALSLKSKSRSLFLGTQSHAAASAKRRRLSACSRKQLTPKKLTVGMRFGRLTLSSVYPTVAVCDCGNTVDVKRTASLFNGDKQSCGCLLKDVAREKQLSIARRHRSSKGFPQDVPMQNENKEQRNRFARETVPAVFKRDDYTCQLCGERGVVLNAHHIEKWTDSPSLRFEISNAVTLCRRCHIDIAHDGNVHGDCNNEVSELLRSIVAAKTCSSCVACGSTHDRDINAARNILGRGRAPLAVGIPVLPRVSGQPEG